MAYSKKVYELTEADMNKYKNNQEADYMAREFKVYSESEEEKHFKIINNYKDIVEDICGLADHADEGYAIEMYCQLDHISKIVKEAKDQVHEQAVYECDSYSPDNKPFTKNEFLIQKRNGSKVYDWNTVKEIKDLQNQINEIKSRYKSAINTNTYTGGKLVLPDGELVDPIKYKFSKDAITVKTNINLMGSDEQPTKAPLNPF